MCSRCSGQALGPTSLPSVPVDQALPWVCGAGYRFPQKPPKYNRSEKSVQQPAALCRLLSQSLARRPRMPGDIAGLPRILLLPGMLLSSGPGMDCSVTGILMSGAPALPGGEKTSRKPLILCKRASCTSKCFNHVQSCSIVLQYIKIMVISGACLASHWLSVS